MRLHRNMFLRHHIQIFEILLFSVFIYFIQCEFSNWAWMAKSEIKIMESALNNKLLAQEVTISSATDSMAFPKDPRLGTFLPTPCIY